MIEMLSLISAAMYSLPQYDNTLSATLQQYSDIISIRAIGTKSQHSAFSALVLFKGGHALGVGVVLISCTLAFKPVGG